MSGKLNQEEYEALHEHNVIERIDPPPKRKISLSYLSPSLIALPDLVYPASLVSVEALEFIGLNRDTAQRIFDNLKSAQIDDQEDEEEAELPSFVREHLTQRNIKFGNLPTADALTSIVLTTNTITAILNPEFREVFGTETPFYWAFDTLRMRFNHVLLVEDKIKKSAERALLAKRQREQPNVKDLFGGKEVLSSQSSGMTRSGIRAGSFHLPRASARNTLHLGLINVRHRRHRKQGNFLLCLYQFSATNSQR
ncbi:hypothetical protein COCMIDRAFT_30493 [Bipolaris oryzae ATCC 44560]|uniref:Uncharacterized protein n=1 Tax=Bipolaris oryzae ATCC 44560 TaxID=930090 RepID=W6ZA65_COCMI|nr:uncharacterized protein COCMIDRAFT_30493 [Bipolaris oryzae ATCC 44560]EUC40606.1 hypothetical protein COCMIDRAFT_30493 [Bipolaris oryzae ATCC 44560]